MCRATSPATLSSDVVAQAGMPSHVSAEIHHQYRLTAAVVTGAEPEQRAFLEGLLQDAPLCQEARRSFLYQLRCQGISGPLLQLAEEDALCTVLRTAFRRLDALLLWNPSLGRLATWWGRQAVFEFNADGRRQAERLCGYWRSSGQTFVMEADHLPDAQGEWRPLELAADGMDPAEGHERASAGATLERLLNLGSDTQAATWLRGWLVADALHDDQPLFLRQGEARLTWKRGQQRHLAAAEGVSDRTLRTRTRRVERMLTEVVTVARRC